MEKTIDIVVLKKKVINMKHMLMDTDTAIFELTLESKVAKSMF